MPVPSGGVDCLSKNTETIDGDWSATIDGNHFKRRITKVLPNTQLVAPRLLNFEVPNLVLNHEEESPWIVVFGGLDRRHPEAENGASRQSQQKQHGT